jgi:hypothetical protein
MNYFEALAQQQMVAATKARHRAREKRAAAKVVKSERDAPMKLSAMEQEQADQSTQLRIWRAFHKAEMEAVRNGPHADDWRELERAVRALTIDNPDALVAHVQAAKWLRKADFQTRRVALSMISNAIIRVRIANGYAPIDDSLPGEEPTAFEIIRNELRVLT